MLQRVETAATLAGVDACRAFFQGAFTNGAHELLLVAHVDRQARCLHLARYEGDEAGVDMPIGLIMSDAARMGGAGMVLAHNHPSGDPRPSHGDLIATRRLAAAGDAFDVPVLDHLIFAGDDCASMRRLGYL